MKLTAHDPKVKLEIEVQKKQEKEKFLFTGILKPQPNQRVFELDLKSMTVKECVYFTDQKTINYMDVVNGTVPVQERKILVKEGFDYAVNLNMENAIKHFKKEWKNDSICKAEDHEGQRLYKNQREVHKYKNKE